LDPLQLLQPSDGDDGSRKSQQERGADGVDLGKDEVVEPRRSVRKRGSTALIDELHPGAILGKRKRTKPASYY